MDGLNKTGIYKLTNVMNGKVYVGQSRRISRRLKAHESDSRRIDDVRGQTPLYEDVRKYGFDKFSVEVLELCEVEELDEKETFFIDLYNSTNPDFGYNRTRYPLALQDPKVQVKIRTPEYYESQGKRMREWNIRQWSDPEYRKMTSARSREVQLERLKNPAYLKEKTEHLKKATDKMKAAVGQYDSEGNLIATFKGLREAERSMGLANDAIGKVCRGVKNRKRAGGYVWRYL